MRRFMSLDIEIKILIAVGVVLVILLAVGIPAMIKSDQKWRAWCEEQGGHADSTSQVNPVIGGKGQTTITTTTFCLSSDGRILDIQ